MLEYPIPDSEVHARIRIDPCRKYQVCYDRFQAGWAVLLFELGFAGSGYQIDWFLVAIAIFQLLELRLVEVGDLVAEIEMVVEYLAPEVELVVGTIEGAMVVAEVVPELVFVVMVFAGSFVHIGPVHYLWLL